MPARKDRLRLAVEVIDGIAVVQLMGLTNILTDHVDELRDGLFSLLDDGGHKRIVINLINVEMIVSLPLYQFVRLNTRVKQAGGQLRLCCLSPLVAEAVHICGFDRILNIDPDEATSLSKF